jgi:hypothetical protein
MITVDLDGVSDDNTLLHYDQERLQSVVDATFAAFHAAAIAANPDDPDAATKLLCGGCAVTFIGALVDKFASQSANELKSVVDFNHSIINRVKARSSLLILDSIMGDIFKP